LAPTLNQIPQWRGVGANSRESLTRAQIVGSARLASQGRKPKIRDGLLDDAVVRG
jgi:hypothetical protein